MEKELLVIGDNEEKYARKLHEYVRTKCSSVFEAVLFTKVDSLRMFLQTHNVDILLISDSFVLSQEEYRHVKHVLRLSSQKETDEEQKNIYRYTPAGELIKKIMQVKAEDEKKTSGLITSHGGKKLKVIGVYSPIKRCFQTTFSVTLGQILSQMGKSLYLNFESFSGLELLGGFRSETDIFDLLYYAECKAGAFAYRVGSLADKLGELDYIPPAHSFHKFRDITGAQWVNLIETLRLETDYEYLILDLSENVIGLFEVLLACDKVYTITDSSRISKAKIAQYEGLVRENSYEKVLEKTENIVIPTFKEIPRELELLPYSDLADYVKNLLCSGCGQ